MKEADSGVLLVGHGTHSPRGQRSFLKLAELLAARLAPLPVEPAFLEIAEPTIAQGIAALARRGAARFVALPLLLFAAGHAKRDIPAALTAAVAGSRLEFCLGEHLGCDEGMVELSRRRFTEALQQRPAMPAADTCLLLVGRGSPDDGATAEMRQFARLRGLSEADMAVEVAFLAMAQPRVGEVIARLAASRYRRIVVQPHLLFHGDLAEGLAAQVAAVRAKNSRQEWLLAPLLADDLGEGGPADELLVALLAGRYHSAAIRIVATSGQG
ncbi:MAG: CbiX/SirB N-terminal domain-containing protein [Pirellulaceae bacterium]|nr:CbiX/SirB N-terminal domain-containing protein [Pirellulaceae bacterium]